MRTFDFYDTLITRLVADPADIFSIVGERLNIPDFRRLRVEAELSARSKNKGEITFNQIYEHLALPDNLHQKARELELELERSLIALVLENASKFQNGDAIVSDMYHDENFFSGALSRLMPNKSPGAILVSCEHGANKSGGDLWRIIRPLLRNHRDHIGDNILADVKQARRHGFRATHYVGTQLNRYEVALQKQGINGSLIAGASRAARASLTCADMTEIDAAITRAFASVISPMLFAFSEWVIQKCLSAGIDHIYFLARDGLLPFRICSALNDLRKHGLTCKYIYASRHALHLPGFKSVETAQSWLLEGTQQLTLRSIARRANIPINVIMDIASEHMIADPDRNIPVQERRLLHNIAGDRRFVDALNISSAEAYDAALGYYRGVGLVSTKSCAVVDVGWNGRMQASLRALLSKNGAEPENILGLYLCLSKRAPQDSRDSLEGFLCEPNASNLPRGLFDNYRQVIEASLSADHPTTVGFEVQNGSSVAILGGPCDAELLNRIRLQHAVVDKFIANVLTLERARGQPINATIDEIVQNFELFLRRPTEADGYAFVDFKFYEGQTESDGRAICRLLSVLEILTQKKDRGFWDEGSLSASGFAALIPIRERLRHMRRSFFKAREKIRHS